MRGGVPPYRKLTLAEAFDNGTVPNANTSSMQAGAARRISVRFAEAAALPCVQNMRGANIIILVLCSVLFGFGGWEGPLGRSKSTAGGSNILENNDLEEESEIIS